MIAPMDLDDDVSRLFAAALPDHVRRNWRMAPAFLPMISAAIRSHGFTPETLAKACTAGIGPATSNPGGVVNHRLRECANGDRGPVVDSARPGRFAQPKPWCGRLGCDEATRWFTDLDTGRLLGRCNECWTEPS